MCTKPPEMHVFLETIMDNRSLYNVADHSYYPAAIWR